MQTTSRETHDFVGYAISTAGVIAAFLIFWLTNRKSRKAVTYGYSTASILSNHEKTIGSMGWLEISFDTIPILSASLVSITIRNSGRTPIQRTDFDEKLSISFRGSAVNVLAAQKSESEPEDVGVTVQIVRGIVPEATGFEIEQLLLNPGDHFTVLALVSGHVDEVILRGRIVGVKEIEWNPGSTDVGLISLSRRESWVLVVILPIVSILLYRYGQSMSYYVAGSLAALTVLVVISLVRRSG